MENVKPQILFPIAYRRISPMTYQPKSVGKMTDFETLTLCISLNSRQICTIFLQRPSYRVLSVPGKKFDSQPSSVFKLIFYPHLVVIGLTSCAIRVWQHEGD